MQKHICGEVEDFSVTFSDVCPLNATVTVIEISNGTIAHSIYR